MVKSRAHQHQSCWAACQPGSTLPTPFPAAALLGEVRAGGAAAMRFEASGEGEEAGQEAARKAEQDAELARMMQLIEERRRKFEADRAVSGSTQGFHRLRGRPVASSRAPETAAGKKAGCGLTLASRRSVIGLELASSCCQTCGTHICLNAFPCRHKRTWAVAAAAGPSPSTTMRSRQTRKQGREQGWGQGRDC